MIRTCSLLLFCQAVLAGNLYNPVGYAAYPTSNLVAPQPISPLHYASPLRTSVGYGPLAAARVGSIAAAPLLAPAPYSLPVAAAPVAPVVSHAAYAAPFLQKYAALPSVAHVPVTRYEAQPGFIQKYVDVAHAKVATSKIQVRRPAIQKQFYDIEERIIVRPVASAVLELDQPISKTHGSTLVSSVLSTPYGLYPAVALPPQIPSYGPLQPDPTYGPPQSLPPPTAPETPTQSPPSAPENSEPSEPSAPESPQFPSAPQNPDFSGPSGSDNGQESDSITVENEDLRARSRMQEPQRNQQQNEQREQPEPQTRSGIISQTPQQISQTQALFLSRSLPSSLTHNLAPQSRSFSNDVIPSSRALLTEQQSQVNQQRLIELLIGRNGITEVRSGVSIDAASEAGQIRGRVLSVTPAPPSSGPADERVSTRRIVVNRPIETLQEVDIVQPFTKLQRLAVQQPAILKTARIGIARVNSVTPVPLTNFGAYSYLH